MQPCSIIVRWLLYIIIYVIVFGLVYHPSCYWGWSILSYRLNWLVRVFIYVIMVCLYYHIYQLLWLGITSKKNPVYLKTLSKLRLTPLPPPYFWQIYFWQSVDHVDLPPSPRIFDKIYEIFSCETCIHYYPYYFLRDRGRDRKTESPLVGLDWVINHTK